MRRSDWFVITNKKITAKEHAVMKRKAKLQRFKMRLWLLRMERETAKDPITEYYTDRANSGLAALSK